MKMLIGGMVATVVMAGSAWAGPFQLADLAADAAWVVHADVEGLRSTRIGDFLLDEMNREDAAAKIDAVKAVFNFDLRTDLLSATLYGVDDRPERAVVLLRGRFDPERLVTLVKSNPTYESNQVGDRAIHSWIDENKLNAKRVYAGFQGTDTLVISEGKIRVVTALNVLAGKAASLDPNGSLAGVIRETSAAFFLAGANLAGIPNVIPNAALLKKARLFQLALTAPGNELEGSMRMTADSSRTAEQLEQILTGMVAFAQLNDADQPELAAMAETVRIAREGDTVQVSLRHAMEEVVDHLKKEAERKRSDKGL